MGRIWKLSAGGGAVLEKRFKPTPQDAETSVYVFVKGEVKDIAKVGPLELAKIAAEAQIAGKPGKNEPPDMSVAVTAGPEVELFGGKLTFGPGGYVQYQTNGEEHTLSAGVKITATGHF